MRKKDGLRILIVDDERPLRRILKTALTAQGYRTFEAATGRSALSAAVKAHPDLIILDLELPDISGIEVVRTLHRRTPVPIVVLSVLGEDSDKVAAFDAGADDYLTKPFSPVELLARLRALMRQWVPQSTDQIFKTGELVFDFGERIVKVQNKMVRLTPTEYDVLKMLVLKSGKIVTNQQLYEGVWDKNVSIERIDHLLRVIIYNLRRKIEPHPAHPNYILTEPSVGYRLCTAE